MIPHHVFTNLLTHCCCTHSMIPPGTLLPCTYTLYVHKSDGLKSTMQKPTYVYTLYLPTYVRACVRACVRTYVRTYVRTAVACTVPQHLQAMRIFIFPFVCTAETFPHDCFILASNQPHKGLLITRPNTRHTRERRTFLAGANDSGETQKLNYCRKLYFEVHEYVYLLYTQGSSTNQIPPIRCVFYCHYCRKTVGSTARGIKTSI